MYPKRLSTLGRARLAIEILAAYVQARRTLRRAPIADVVAALREPRPEVAADRAGPDSADAHDCPSTPPSSMLGSPRAADAALPDTMSASFRFRYESRA